MKLTLLKKLMIGIASLVPLTFQLNAGTCMVNLGVDYQTIDGFGFSSAWCGQLSSAKNNALYGTLGMSILRVHISETGSWGYETSNSVAAHAAGALVLGSSWAAPSWMTDTNRVVLPQYYADYANWLGKAATNMLLDYVSPANEPDLNGFPWTTTQMFNFIKNDALGIGKPVAMPESFRFDEGYSDPVLNDPVAVKNCAIVVGHIYGGLGDHGNHVQTNAIARGKRVWMTEHYIDDTQTNIANCMVLAKEVNDCMNNQMNAYLWWWVNEGEPSVNLASDNGTIFKNGYTLGQFAKWVRPGKTHCSATYNPSSSVYVTAYHGGGVVLVAVNTGTSAVSQTFTFQNASGVNAFAAYRTSDTENMAALPAVGVYTNTFTYTLPPQSVTTFNQILSSPPAAGTYKIINKNSGKAMDNIGFNTANGASVDQWTYNSGNNQKWTLTNLGNNLYKIIGVYSGNSVDIDGWGTTNGTKVQTWDYLGGTNQKFFIIPTGGGYFELVPSHAMGSCLDVTGASTADGAKVQLWQWLGGANQQWSFQTP